MSNVVAIYSYEYIPRIYIIWLYGNLWYHDIIHNLSIKSYFYLYILILDIYTVIYNYNIKIPVRCGNVNVEYGLTHNTVFSYSNSIDSIIIPTYHSSTPATISYETKL
jgi:hypothetical protein